MSIELFCIVMLKMNTSREYTFDPHVVSRINVMGIVDECVQGVGTDQSVQTTNLGN